MRNRHLAVLMYERCHMIRVTLLISAPPCFGGGDDRGNFLHSRYPFTAHQSAGKNEWLSVNWNANDNHDRGVAWQRILMWRWYGKVLTGRCLVQGCGGLDE